MDGGEGSWARARDEKVRQTYDSLDSKPRTRRIRSVRTPRDAVAFGLQSELMTISRLLSLSSSLLPYRWYRPALQAPAPSQRYRPHQIVGVVVLRCRY